MASFLVRSGLLLCYFGVTFVTIRLLRRCETILHNASDACVSLPFGKEKLVCGSTRLCDEATDKAAIDCRVFVNASKLNGRLLKLLLNRRGIASHGLLEKEELAALLNQAGALSIDEIKSALMTRPQTEVVTFESSVEFVERVQDSADSVWLLRVVMDAEYGQDSSALPLPLWRSLMEQYGSMGMRFGVVDCSRLSELCSVRDFESASLILVVPRNLPTHKIPVILKMLSRSPSGTMSLLQISKWLNDALIQITENQLKESDSISSPSTALRLSLVYNSCLSTQIPLVLPFLAIRFAGRFRITVTGCPEQESEESPPVEKFSAVQYRPFSVHARISVWPFRAVLKRDHSFGKHLGEWPTFESLSLLLTTCYPEKNDLFMLGLYWCGLACLLQFFCCGTIALHSLPRRLFTTLWTIFLTSVIYLMACLPVVGLFSYLLQYAVIYHWGLALTTNVGLSEFVAIIRGDIATGWWSLPITLPIFVFFGCCITVVYYYRGDPLVELETASLHDRHADASTHERHRSPSPLFRHSIGDALSSWSDIEMGTFLQTLGHIHLNLPMEPYRPSFLERLPTFHYAVQTTSTSRNSTSAEENEEESNEDKDASSSIPSTPEGWPKDVMYSTQCVICLDRYRETDLICHLPCGHAFHNACVKTWLLRNITRPCPTCRWPAFKVKPL